jgi:chemotaxis protein CheX
MVDQQLVVDALRSATEDVFSTMLDLEIECRAPFIETGVSSPSQGIVALVGLAGAWVGTVSVCCSASLGCRICSRMLCGKFTVVGEQVLDAVSEITHMIVGSFKTEAEAYLGPLGLSIPTVIYGLSFSARTAGGEQWIVVPFFCGNESIDIRICLARNRPLPRLVSMSPAHQAHR